MNTNWQNRLGCSNRSVNSPRAQNRFPICVHSRLSAVQNRLLEFSKLACIGLAVLCSLSASAAQGPKQLRLAQQNPKGHPLVAAAEKLAEIVAAKSNGRLKISLFPGGVLGSDQANVSSLQGGTLDMVALNSGILASQAKEFAVYDFPFLFVDPKEADAIVDGAFGKMMHDKLLGKGMVGLAYWEQGFRDITNSKRPITKVEDIAGLKLRVIPNAINVDWVSALGANPTPLPFPEVYAALDQKAIDGQENPVAVIFANKFYEVQKFLVLTHHQYNPQSVIFSKKVWDTLSADDQKILREAAIEAGKFERQISRDADASVLADLKAKGMTVTELPPAELAKLRDKMKPVIDKHSATVGADVVAAIRAELTKVRK